ncbi:MAG: tetratricopeptide repeat protein [Candidatus Promineifilaceae bacterium]|jgi:TPR repeat protein
MKNGLIIAIIGLLMLGILAGGIWLLSSGETADAATIDAANQLYVSGHYSEAARIYEQEIARGVQDSTVYFNLGNAYFEQGDMGRAVLNLQRAAELAPRDPDIQANLELAQQQTTELFAEEPTGPVAILAGLTSWMTLNEAAILVLALWFLLGFFILAYREIQGPRGRRLAQTLALVVLILMLLAGVSLASRSFLLQTQPPGVVVTPSVAISDSPGASSPSSYHLTGGTEVKVIDQVGDWIRLDTPQGAGESWVPATAVEPIT